MQELEFSKAPAKKNKTFYLDEAVIEMLQGLSEDASVSQNAYIEALIRRAHSEHKPKVIRAKVEAAKPARAPKAAKPAAKKAVKTPIKKAKRVKRNG